MKVVVDSLVKGAGRATGVVAVIDDVFRAFTSAAVVLANGASFIFMVRSVEGSAGTAPSRDRSILHWGSRWPPTGGL
jgi:phosphosulfolactate phosphohydrolase-like enzyme